MSKVVNLLFQELCKIIPVSWCEYPFIYMEGF
jgi:hypothetical protein